MAADDLRHTAEFCALVGAPNLLVYLGLDEGCSAEDARTALKARRKFMQGMQSNPKYKNEALFLIRHFSSLNEVLEDPAAYVEDTKRRSESVHMPVIEMTIRGVLATGTPPTTEQVEFLRRNALELGVSEATFERRLRDLADESGVTLPGASIAPEPPPGPEPAVAAPFAPAPSVEPEGGPSAGDSAPPVPVEAPPPLTSLPPRHLQPDAAAEPAPELPEAARHAPNPEAWGQIPRVKPSEALTVFITEETEDVRRQARLEILGEPVRRLRLGSRIPEIRIRNGGDGPMGGTVSTDVPWLRAQPSRLDPNAREQVVSVKVSQKKIPDGQVVGSVVIATDNGERARIVYDIRRGPPIATVVAVLLLAMTSMLVIAGVVLTLLLRRAL